MQTEPDSKPRRRRWGCIASIAVVAMLLVFAPGPIREWRRQIAEVFAIANFGMGGGSNHIDSIAFTPDGDALVVAYNRPADARFWDVRTGNVLRSFVEEGFGTMHRVALSPDGRILAVGIENRAGGRTEAMIVRLRDAESGEQIRDLDMPAALSISPNGTLVAAGYQMRQFPGGAVVWQFSKPDRFLMTDQTFSPDGTLQAVSGFIDGSRPHSSLIVVVWDVKTGQVVKSLHCPGDVAHGTCPEAKSVRFHPDGKRLAIGTITDLFYIWNIQTDEVKLFHRPDGRWWSVCFSPDGKLLAVSGAGGTVLIWDVEAEKEIAALKGHVLSVYALEFSPNGELLASAGEDGIVRLWGEVGILWKGWGLVRELRR